MDVQGIQTTLHDEREEWSIAERLVTRLVFEHKESLGFYEDYDRTLHVFRCAFHPVGQQTCRVGACSFPVNEWRKSQSQCERPGHHAEIHSCSKNDHAPKLSMTSMSSPLVLEITSLRKKASKFSDTGREPRVPHKCQMGNFQLKQHARANSTSRTSMTRKQCVKRTHARHGVRANWRNAATPDSLSNNGLVSIRDAPAPDAKRIQAAQSKKEHGVNHTKTYDEPPALTVRGIGWPRETLPIRLPVSWVPVPLKLLPSDASSMTEPLRARSCPSCRSSRIHHRKMKYQASGGLTKQVPPPKGHTVVP